MDPASHDAISRLAQEVATHLPGEWTVIPFPIDWGRRGARLVEQAGAMLSIGDSQDVSDRQKMRLVVHTDYPRDSGGAMSVARRPSIKVSALKTGQQIAQDIERRLLPQYLPLLEKELERQHAWDKHEMESSSLAQQIARLVKVDVNPTATDVNFYRSPYDLFHETMSGARVIDSNEVELTLRLDGPTALQVLNLLIHGQFRMPE
jgi:hypothetical protein